MYFEETLKQAERYSDRIVEILVDQKAKYDELSVATIQNELYDCIDENNKLILPANALIRGTSFNKDKMQQIKKEGLLSSEFAQNKPEKYGETYYMVDFFKNVTNVPLNIDKLLNCTTNGNLLKFLPYGILHDNKPKVAFVVASQDESVRKYLSRDAFSENNNELLEFFDEDFIYEIRPRRCIKEYGYVLGQSSFPIGVPYSAISGIILDYMIEQDADALNFIKKTFGKDLLIISSNGNVLSTPKTYLIEIESCVTL
ncbi:MAG: DUF2913 family protein [Clostridia bacterium]|nr:DUF2913 family protein [Clostridia bacterium]